MFILVGFTSYLPFFALWTKVFFSRCFPQTRVPFAAFSAIIGGLNRGHSSCIASSDSQDSMCSFLCLLIWQLYTGQCIANILSGNLWRNSRGDALKLLKWFLLYNQNKEVLCTFRLEEKLASLEKSEDEVSRWHDDLAAIQEEVQKVESVCEQQMAPDLEALDKQKKDAQVD